MTDSIQIFKPGFRVEDSAGDPVSGAIIYFFDAGTTTPRTVYSDYALTVALGTSVTCNSVGVPTSNGTTVAEVYTGNSRYKIEIRDSGGTLIPGFSWDNIIGALDTSTFATTGEVAAAFSAKSADYTILTSDDQTLFEFDSTAASRTATLPSAITAGAGFLVGIRKKVLANSVTAATVSAETIRHGTTTTPTTYVLGGQGEQVWLESDGANWFVREGGALTLPVGTTTVAPLVYQAGTNLATAAVGASEFDGTCFYDSAIAFSRQVRVTEQFMLLSAAYTLTSTTSSQKLFNASSAGQIVLQAATYFFECMFSLSAMSATSGNAKFDLLGAGTAVLASQGYAAVGGDSTTQTTAAAVGGTYNTASPSVGDIVTAATNTGMWTIVRGVVRVTTAGTIIPSVALTTAATPAVAANSWFRIWPVGSNTVTSQGAWS